MAQAISTGAEMLELRTDYLEDLSVELVRKLLPQAGDTPLIVTCRDEREGGAHDYPESLRVAVLCDAIKSGVAFVDIEWANFTRREFQLPIEAALQDYPKTRLILSAHDFTGPFADIKTLHHQIIETYPQAIPKLVYTANHINDCFEAFDLLHEATRPCIVLCMGLAGLISRVLARKLGGYVTFASSDPASATAPGQLTIEQLKGLYRHDTIDTKTELFGVMADPVGHSLSPAIHNACLGDKGLNGLYLPLLVQGGRDELFTFLDNVLARPWMAFRGFSVTIPHKHSVLEYVRIKGGDIEPLVEKIGAANTIVIDTEGHISAYNTDYAGALDAITETMGMDRKDLAGVSAAVVGAGGVARAIVAGLTDAGAKVTIYNRTIERAEKLAADFDCAFAGRDALKTLDAKLVINGTSIGMHPDVDRTPVPAEAIKPDMAVFDTIYNPAETLLLKNARAVGAQTIDGITMFVNQAMAQFHLFTGQQGNPALMRDVVIASLR